jgi:hypothetical protein
MRLSEIASDAARLRLFSASSPPFWAILPFCVLASILGTDARFRVLDFCSLLCFGLTVHVCLGGVASLPLVSHLRSSTPSVLISVVWSNCEFTLQSALLFLAGHSAIVLPTFDPPLFDRLVLVCFGIKGTGSYCLCGVPVRVGPFASVAAEFVSPRTSLVRIGWCIDWMPPHLGWRVTGLEGGIINFPKCKCSQRSGQASWKRKGAGM